MPREKCAPKLLCLCCFADIDECALKIHTCWNDSACVNLPGGFDCLCPSGPSCTGDCPHEGGFKRNGQVWTLREDRCSVCSCKVRSSCPGARESFNFLGSCQKPEYCTAAVVGKKNKPKPKALRQKVSCAVGTGRGYSSGKAFIFFICTTIHITE